MFVQNQIEVCAVTKWGRNQLATAVSSMVENNVRIVLEVKIEIEFYEVSTNNSVVLQVDKLTNVV